MALKKTSVRFNQLLMLILEPVLLGIASNIVVGFIFNPDGDKFILEEFIAAIILSVPITMLNRYIDRRLERKVRWAEHPLQRCIIHFLILSLCLIILLNTLGAAYMQITQKGFFSLEENLIINLVTLCLAVLLTFIKWGIHFYQRWIFAENNASASEQIIADLKRKLIQPIDLIEIQKGTSKLKIKAQTVRIAKIEFGIVRIYSDTGPYGIFPGTLSQLSTLLPEHLFFQAGRDAILHKQTIQSISSSTFGKIQVKLLENYRQEEGFIISRPKAAAFRKWFNSIST
jgi:hypothetical protein